MEVWRVNLWTTRKIKTCIFKLGYIYDFHLANRICLLMTLTKQDGTLGGPCDKELIVVLHKQIETKDLIWFLEMNSANNYVSELRSVSIPSWALDHGQGVLSYYQWSLHISHWIYFSNSEWISTTVHQNIGWIVIWSFQRLNISLLSNSNGCFIEK